MLNTYISSSNKLAPDVFIDSSEINDTYITVNYHLENDDTNWLYDSSVLDNLNLSIFLNETGSVENLSNFKKRTQIKNSYLYGSIDLPYVSNDVFLTAYCGNDKIVGQKVSEQVLSVNSPAKSENLTFLNKNKDLRILNITNIDTGSQPSEYKKYSRDLYVSHNTNKKASLGYVFNLEEYFYENSKIYRVFEKNPYYKSLIFSSSYVAADDVKFFKRNLTYPSDYQEISTDVNIYRTDISSISSSYIFSTIDDNNDLLNKNKYAVKIKVKVTDYSYSIFKDQILDPLYDIKNYIINYKNLFETLFLNNLIQDKYKFFFENKYQEEIPKISVAVKQLSTIYAFCSTKHTKDEFASLFASILHPLTTRVDLIDRLLSSIESLQAMLASLLTNVSQPSVDSVKDNSYDATFEYEFAYKDAENKQFYDSIDYNYDLYCGYEVFSSDTLDTRKKINKTGLDVYTVEEKNARKRLEAGKYFTNTSPEFYEKIIDFSISTIDLGKESFDTLIFENSQDLSFFNKLYMQIIQYNNNTPPAKIPDYYYFELLKNNVYIKSIGSRNNGEINGMFPTTISDPNEETSAESLKYITDTGINYLYYLIDKNIYIDPRYVIQENAATEDNKNNYGSVFYVTDEIKKNPEIKPKLILFYNTIYKDNLIVSGSTYSIYSLEEAVVHDLFTKKLKLFNKYYILLDENNLQENDFGQNYILNLLINTLEIPGLDQELSNSTESKYFNRTVEDSVVLLTTSEI